MSIRRRPSPLPLLAIVALLMAAPTSLGHVDMVSPNGGEVLIAGGTATLSWMVQIQHPTIGWELAYSTNGLSGPWTQIAYLTPPGDISAGSVHSYTWFVPANIDSSTVRIRVQQDNTGTDYYGTSNANLTIARNLEADVPGISISAGGTQTLTYTGSPAQAASTFVALGSILGPVPGLMFQGTFIPLTPDFYFTYTVQNVNQPPLVNGLGVLDQNGGTQVHVTIPPGVLTPAAVGITLHHAIVVVGGAAVTAVSSPATVTFTP